MTLKPRSVRGQTVQSVIQPIKLGHPPLGAPPRETVAGRAITGMNEEANRADWDQAYQGVGGVSGSATITTPGPPGPPGPIGPAGGAIPVINVMAAQYGAIGDGVHDDTAAINAAVDAAIAPASQNAPAAAQRYDLVFPPGIFKTSGIVIDRPGGIYSGFHIRGAGPSIAGQPLDGGTALVLTGSAQALITVKSGAFYDSSISDMSLFVTPTALYGIWFQSCTHSRTLLENLEIGYSNGSGQLTCIRVDNQPSESNGELTIMRRVSSSGLVGCLYQNTNGQAFNDAAYDCSAFLAQGGAAFRFGSTTGGPGYQFIAHNFEGTASQPVGASGNMAVMLDLSGGSFYGNIVVQGSRFEHGPPLVLPTNDENCTGHVAIMDSTFDGYSGNQDLISGGGTNCRARVDMLRNIFNATPGMTVAATVQTYMGHSGAQGSLARFNWQGNTFSRFSSFSLGAAPSSGAYDGAVLTDNWSISADPAVLAPVPVTN